MSTATLDFLADVGEKVTDIPITIRYAKYNPGSWNRSASMFIIAETDAGQTIKISGSSQSLFGLARGDEVTIAEAKVKGHGEHRGTPQTILYYVKIERPEPEEEEFEEEAPVRYTPPAQPDESATTTLAKFAGVRRRNYETLPTKDVEILPDVHHCRECGELIEFDPKAGLYGWGEWKHADPGAPDHGYVSPKTRCRYCHSEEHAVYRQHAWHDAVECSRCGGEDGHAIGD